MNRAQPIKRYFSALVLVPLMSATALSAQPCCEHAEFTLRFSSQSHSEPVSIDAWSNAWQGEFTPGERTHSYNQIRALYQTTQGWRYGLMTRVDYEVQFSEATARLYYEDSNALLEATPASDLYLKIQHLRAAGITLGYQFKLDDQWDIGLDLTRLRAHDIYEGQIAGTYAITPNQAYAIDAQVDYAYQNDALLNRPPEAPTLGWGWTADFFTRWHSEDNRWHLRFDLQDGWSQITWKDVPYTQARINTVNRLQGGSIQFNPTLEGAESFRKQRQKLPVRARFLAEYALGYYLTTHFSAETLPVENEYGFGFTIASAQNTYQTFTVSAILPVGALQLQHRYGPFYWSLGTDALDWRSAHWLKIEGGLSVFF